MRGYALVVAGAACAASVLLTPTSSAGAAGGERRGDPYETYVACTTRAAAPASHSCPKRHKKGAFFTSIDRDVTYKVCVKFPNNKRLCATHQEAPQGTKRVNPITSDQVGRHVVTWFVHGEQVGQFRFRIHR